MAALTSLQTEMINQICNTLLDTKGIRFIAVINKNGRKIAGGFRKGIKPLVNSKKIQMHHMQLCLDITMRKDFTGMLGEVEHIIAERKKVNIICLPVGQRFIMVSLDKSLDVKRTIKKIRNIFEKETKNFL